MAKPKFGNVTGFDWDEANISHIAKHNVTPAEAEEIFFDQQNVLDNDLDHSQTEQRFIIIGKNQRRQIALSGIYKKRR